MDFVRSIVGVRAYIVIPFLLFGIFISHTAQAAEFTTDTVIDIDTTWTLADSPYVVNDDVEVFVEEGITLTIEPGAVIKLGDAAELNVNGIFDAVGTELLPIIFTSIKDDSIGGDSNGDGNLTQPSGRDKWGVQLGNWRSPTYTSGKIEYVEFRYSFASFYVDSADIEVRNVRFATTTYSLTIDFSNNVSVENVEFDGIERGGINIYNSSSTIKHVVVTNSDSPEVIGIYGSPVLIQDIELYDILGSGIGIYDSSVVIQDLFAHDVTFAEDIIEVYDSEVIIRNATVHDSPIDSAVLGLYSSYATVTDSVFNGGGEYGIFAFGNRYSPTTGLVLDNVVIEDFWDFGIILDNATAHITNSHVGGNINGIAVWQNHPAEVVVSNSSIMDSAFIGIYQDGPLVADMRGNWWGDPSGPFHEIDNPDGFGDEILGDVDFSDWLTAPPNEQPEEDEIDPLLLQYAPTLYLHPDEDYLPVNVEAFVEGSALWSQAGIGDTNIATDDDLTFEMFETIANNDDTSDYYLAFSDPDNAKSIDLATAKTKYDSLVASGEATTTYYAYKMEDSFTDDHGVLHEFIVLQYWYFYAMNNWREQDGRNDHEGDWESVFIFLDKNTEDPMYVAYSSHLNDGDPSFNILQYDSVRRSWNSQEIVLANERLVSFVSLGSHANYPNNGNDGDHVVDFSFSDVTSLIGPNLSNHDLLILPFNSDTNSIWSMYEGKWGTDGSSLLGGDNGPEGPRFIDVTGEKRFDEPIEWAGIDRVVNLTVDNPVNEFSFPSLGVKMRFSDALSAGEELFVSAHDEFISFGQNVSNIHFLPKFWDLETSLPNGEFETTVSFDFVRDQLAKWGVDEEFMEVYIYNESENFWEPVPSLLDPTSNTISFNTNHFSRYAIGSPNLMQTENILVVKSHLGKYDQTTDTREALVTIHNKGQNTFTNNVRVVVRNLDQSEVHMLEASGITNNGDYYLDTTISDLKPNKKITLPTLRFSLPTVVHSAAPANSKSKKPNAEFKTFSYNVELLKIN